MTEGREYNPELFGKDYYEKGARGGFMKDGYTWENIEPHAKRKLTYIEREFKRFGMKSILFGCCAKGFEVKEARRRGYDAKGVDISAYAIKNVDPDVMAHCFRGDLRDLSRFKTDSFDVVVAFDCIHTIDPADREKAYQELNRVAKKGLLLRTRIHTEDSGEAVRDGSFDGTPACRETFYTIIDKVHELDKFSIYTMWMDFRHVGWFCFVKNEFFTIANRLDRNRVIKPEFMQKSKAQAEEASDES